MGDLPTPPYTEATEAAERELRTWASKYVGPELTAAERSALVSLALRAATPGLIAAGRAQAAADIRALAVDQDARGDWREANGLPESRVQWNRVSAQALRRAAQVAEGDQSKDPR